MLMEKRNIVYGRKKIAPDVSILIGTKFKSKWSVIVVVNNFQDVFRDGAFD